MIFLSLSPRQQQGKTVANQQTHLVVFLFQAQDSMELSVIFYLNNSYFFKKKKKTYAK